MKNIKIYDDDDPVSIIQKVNDLIYAYGIEIIESDSGNGWVKYELVTYDM